MGDVGAVATLIDTIAKWFLSDQGYISFRRKQKLKELDDAISKAVEERRWHDLDALNAELDQLRRDQSS